MQNVKAMHKFWISLSLTAISAGNPILLWGGAIALSVPSSAQAAVLTQWRFDPANRQLEVTVPEGTTPRYFLLAQPARIVLDLPNTSIGSVPEQQNYSGLVRQIRVGQFEGTTTRIVIELAPNAVLAPRQVELQPLNGNRWVLRPLFAGDTSSIAQNSPAPNPTSTSPAISPPTPQPSAPPLAATVPPPAGALTPPDSAPPALDATRPTPPPTAPVLDATTANATIVPDAVAQTLAQNNPEGTPPTPEVAATNTSDRPVENASPALPPLEPGAIEIPIVPPADPIEANSTVETSPSTASEPDPAPSPTDSLAPAPVAIAPTTSPPAASALPPAPPVDTPPVAPLPAVESALPPSAPIAIAPPAPVVPAPNPGSVAVAPQPIELPPPTSSNNQPTTVAVPPLQPTPPVQLPGASSALPPSTAIPNLGATVSVPPLTSRPAANLPTLPSAVPTPPAAESVAVAPTPPVLLPEGTVLSLRYPRNTALSLAGDRAWQEVLVLAQAVRDRAGNIILPEGSQVIGRFETGSRGSQFIAQAISIGGRNVLIQAESLPIDGEREISDRRLVRNSTLGALALTVLGSFTGIGLIAGVAAGAAAGAATTYVTSPQPALIQPNQIVEVRLMEAVRTLQ